MRVAVGALVTVDVGSIEGVGEGVSVILTVGVAVGGGVPVTVSVTVSVAVGVNPMVGVYVRVPVCVGVGVRVDVPVRVDVRVRAGVRVTDGVRVNVGVGVNGAPIWTAIPRTAPGTPISSLTRALNTVVFPAGSAHAEAMNPQNCTVVAGSTNPKPNPSFDFVQASRLSARPSGLPCPSLNRQPRSLTASRVIASVEKTSGSVAGTPPISGGLISQTAGAPFQHIVRNDHFHLCWYIFSYGPQPGGTTVCSKPGFDYEAQAGTQ